MARNPGLPAAILLIAMALEAAAAPIDCPPNEDTFACFVMDGSSALATSASSADGGSFVVSASTLTGGGSQTLVEVFAIFDGTSWPDILLEAPPTQDAQTRTVQAAFVEAGSAPRFRVDAEVTLTDTPSGAVVVETATLTNLLPDALLELRLYSAIDPTVSGTPGDDLGIFDGDSTLFFGDAGGSIRMRALTGGPPDAEVGGLTLLGGLLLAVETDTPFPDLSNGTEPFGPGDLSSVLSWDLVLAPSGSAAITVEKVLVPEPSTALLLGAGLLALGATTRS